MPNGVTLPELKWEKSPNFSNRDAGSKIDLIVLHDTEGGYQGAIGWFAEAKSQVSAHVVLREDGNEATQMVEYAKKAWHAEAFNSRAIGIEMAGFKARGFKLGEWQKAARIVAFYLHKYDLPARWARGGKGAGFARHFDLGAAGGGHFDPTTNLAKWLWFVYLVKREYKRGGFRPDWGK